jgi:hypothetical protein
MSCGKRSLPSAEIDASTSVKVVGPPPLPMVTGVLPVREDLSDVEPVFVGPGPVPEIPPPRA